MLWVLDQVLKLMFLLVVGFLAFHLIVHAPTFNNQGNHTDDAAMQLQFMRAGD